MFVLFNEKNSKFSNGKHDNLVTIDLAYCDKSLNENSTPCTIIFLCEFSFLEDAQVRTDLRQSEDISELAKPRRHLTTLVFFHECKHVCLVIEFNKLLNCSNGMLLNLTPFNNNYSNGFPCLTVITLANKSQSRLCLRQFKSLSSLSI